MPVLKSQKTILYLLFALSGFCALVYEILWARYLSLTFGTSIVAVSLVTATFMCGLALGSYFVGRYCERWRNLLLLYGLLEVGIAVSALAFPLLLSLVRNLYIWAVGVLPEASALTWPLYLFCASIILLVPAICMGGTLPVMCRLFRNDQSGGRVGVLYGLNTLGATLGTLACGFVLIPSFGMLMTGLFAVAGNLLVAVVSIILGKNGLAEEPVSRPLAASEQVQFKDHSLLFVCIGFVGFFSLGYEILWTRVFLLLLGNTTYAFSMMLGAYLIGIALGGGLYGILVKAETDNRKLLTRLVLGLGLSILLTAPFYDRLSYVFQIAYESSNEIWSLYVVLSFGIVFIIMAVPTILSGAALPAVVNIVSSGQENLGRRVGMVVFCNTLGAVIGSLLAGLLLIPHLGILNSFQLIAFINLMLASVLWYRNRTRGVIDRLLPVLIAFGVVAVVLPLKWNGKLLTAGVYYYAPQYVMSEGLHVHDDGVELVDLWEGIDTTVSVHDAPDGTTRFFRVNGKSDGGSGRQDMVSEILAGHLPMLLHDAPQDVMVVGLGTGITLRGLTDYAVSGLECVEISPGVVAAEKYFRKFNRDALSDPRVKLTVADARNRLLVSNKAYDVIVSVPSNPWQTGNSNLFTDNFYRLVLSRLKQGGAFCQWLDLYDMTTGNLRSAVKTFLHTFPHAVAFKAGSDLILVGGPEALVYDYGKMSERMTHPGIADALQVAGVESVGDLFGKYYLFATEPLKSFSESGVLVTDDKSPLEFGAKFNFGMDAFLNKEKRNMQALLEAKGGIFLPIKNLGKNASQTRNSLKDLIDGFKNAGRKAESDFLVQYLRQI